MVYYYDYSLWRHYIDLCPLPSGDKEEPRAMPEEGAESTMSAVTQSSAPLGSAPLIQTPPRVSATPRKSLQESEYYLPWFALFTFT